MSRKRSPLAGIRTRKATSGASLAVHDAGGSPMKRSMTAVALALAVAFLAAFGSLAGPTATASAATSIDMLNYLTFPHQTAGDICSAERKVRLRGKYRFGVYTRHRLYPARFVDSRVIRLNGVYNWKVCLHRNLSRTYQVDSGIRNVNSGGNATVNYTEFGTIRGNGYYDWGSFFDKEF
jgi:hypothetical protein